MTTNNRISSPAIAGPDADRLAQIQAVLELTEEPTADTQPEPKLNGNSRITNPVPSTAPKAPFVDRFGTRFGVGQDFGKNQSFAECIQLFAREMARHFDIFCNFQFDKNPARQPGQVLHSHQTTDKDFGGQVEHSFDWLSDLSRIGYRAQATVADASNFDRLAKVTSDAREWARTSTHFPLSHDPASFKPKTSPFSRDGFALISPQEQLEHVRRYWREALLMHSSAILTAAAQCVEVDPLELTTSSLFGVIKHDELHSTATFNYLTREQVHEEQVEREQKTKLRRFFSAPVQRTTTTKTVTKTRQLVHHQHSLINVEMFAYQPAMNAPWLQMPEQIKDLMRACPAFIRPFLTVYAGDLAFHQTIARDVEKTQTFTTEHQDMVLRPDPAWTLFRSFVLTAWSPQEMQGELQRRSQVRVRQLRQTQIASEKGLAAEQKAEELKELRRAKFWSRLQVVGGLAAVAFVVSVLPAHVHPPLIALFLSALVTAPYLVHFAARHFDVAKRYRSAVRELDTENVRLKAELDTLNSTPVSEL